MPLKLDTFEIKLNLNNSQIAIKLSKLSSSNAQTNTWGRDISSRPLI